MSIIWIPGGTTGIGERVSDYMTDRGHEVIVTGKEVDVRSRCEINDFLNMQEKINGVIYSAGVNYLDYIQSTKPFEIREMFDVNVVGFINVVAQMVTKYEHGKILAICSDASHRPMRTSIGYCASKAALAMAIKCAARELAPDWCVIGVSPSAVDGTPMTNYVDERVSNIRSWDNKYLVEYDLSSIPMKRRTDVAEVSRFICDIYETSSFLTGTIVDFTGGR